MARPRDISRINRAVAVMAVGALAVAALALSAVALQRGNPDTPSGTPSPVPTFALGVPSTPTVSPSPALTPAPVADTAPGAKERYLSIASGGMWRATAGECGVTAPIIERSTDGGATWSDVTPTYRGIGEVHSLAAFAGTEAEMVASMGDACDVELLRTFTQGQFWEPYDEILAASTFLSPTDSGTVITPDGEVSAPCDSAWGLRASGDDVALICDGTAYRLVDGAWATLTGTAPAALTLVDGDVVVAHEDVVCPGLAITRFSDESTSAGCLDVVSPTAVSLTTRGAEIVAWAGDQIVPTGG